MILSRAIITAFIPEPHILLTVVQSTLTGKPAPKATCLAGACPRPAGNTQPMITSSIFSAGRFARVNAARKATCPKLTAEISLKEPNKPQSGVRAAPTITISLFTDFSSHRTTQNVLCLVATQKYLFYIVLSEEKS